MMNSMGGCVLVKPGSLKDGRLKTNDGDRARRMASVTPAPFSRDAPAPRFETTRPNVQAPDRARRTEQPKERLRNGPIKLDTEFDGVRRIAVTVHDRTISVRVLRKHMAPVGADSHTTVQEQQRFSGAAVFEVHVEVVEINGSCGEATAGDRDGCRVLDGKSSKAPQDPDGVFQGQVRAIHS